MIFKQKVTELDLHKEQKLAVLGVFPVVFLFFGIFQVIMAKESLGYGLLKIASSPTILITDFFEVGGVGASFINAAVIGFFNLYLLKRFKLRINGLLIAAFMTVLGFSFFGKNFLNILPLYLGGYFYALYQKIPMKNVILVIMFSTALAPLVSEIAFSGVFPVQYSYVMGASIGILIGFIIVPLSSHMIRFHDGFNLYNIGFASGIIGTVFTSVLRSFKMDIGPENILYLKHNTSLYILLGVLFLYLIIIGFWINAHALKEYAQILKYRGRTITDFTQLVGYGLTFFNMGVMGILSLGIVMLFKGILNGPVIAGIFTIVGFSAFGKHPKNCFPIVLGVLIAGYLIGMDLSSTGFIISVLFSTTIAPIAGTYGLGIGIIAGMLHLALVTNIGVIHGGINLYNNGFSGGLVAGFLVPIVDAFRKGD
ncbi:DUF1576 domain-containing protein [Fusibacter sp. 3D3]|uniref:DUF1576 domain-containing protein n=1 Tax=Fusibacter sp. 3D3 TaxID=1048380 RepID=UPI000856AFB1|nr:DUF1576 domain-containing protein [Fusibacter sp. 3D3]GAU77805.1 permeases of the major facilitator superfamily [Fusibacter sp. 3D3]